MTVRDRDSTNQAQQDPVLLVDVGGVLLLHNPDLLMPITARYGGVDTYEAFQRAHFACHNLSRSAHGPEIDYYDLFPSCAGIPADRQDEFREEYRAFSRTKNMCNFPDPAAKAELSRIVDAGIPVAVVSQADGTIVQMLLDAEMCQVGEGPGVPVDVVLDSAVVGFSKPDPRLFLHAIELLGADPARAVHVGDTVRADVRGAQAAGILALHYDPYDNCNDDPDNHAHIKTLDEVWPYLEALSCRRRER